MPTNLQGKRVAILATDGFEQVELTEPRDALREAGAQVTIVSPTDGRIRGWNHTEWGDSVDVDKTLDQVDAREFDALLLPGGVMNPDHLRMNEKAVSFTKAFAEARKPIAAICHGPWVLIDAGIVKGRKMTSYPSLETDLANAGAEWVDDQVVVDGGIVTSRKPDDLKAFSETAIEVFGS